MNIITLIPGLKPGAMEPGNKKHFCRLKIRQKRPLANLKPFSIAPAFRPGLKDDKPLKLRALARCLSVKE